MSGPSGASGAGGGGRGGARRGPPGTVNIGGVELNWDLSGLDIPKGPTELFPPRSMRPFRKPSAQEESVLENFLGIRESIHNGPFYTVLNDGMKNGFKPKGNKPAPTAASLFNTFLDNETYTAKYNKVQRRIPKLDTRPYARQFFPKELRGILGDDPDDLEDEVDGPSEEGPAKKRKTLAVSQETVLSRIDRLLKEEEEKAHEDPNGDEDAEDDEDDEEDDEKPDAVDEDDDFSAASSGSEESGDDYNAEQYFDNGDDDDIDDADPYENTYE
ncbi:hypothetical protein K505DRAFT_238881 [Melanomma pulvis-pyrius CBS 109.77]|uniref:DNA-directed RNA polymerase III subunit n=1 Tax=Melanomma pulvis-pyrius CBS 109.77 TaxID=1314802 RepID=A0A6A6XHP6_9PLEO|nr:hypothetical protein K505DRAFT_238881 [Melanomma pulvis-pyrius CBS 109.77]